jgi:hypothetical protein
LDPFVDVGRVVGVELWCLKRVKETRNPWMKVIVRGREERQDGRPCEYDFIQRDEVVAIGWLYVFSPLLLQTTTV